MCIRDQMHSNSLHYVYDVFAGNTNSLLYVIITGSFPIIFGSQSKDFNQNLVVIQMEIVSLHTDNKFVEPANESPLTSLGRAVNLAKNS